MATPTLWKSVAVSMQSAIGAALTVTGITNANPAVVTSTAHGLANGDYVLMTVNGMTEVDGRLLRIANIAVDTFELEGIDSTDFDTFTSGTAKEVTLGTSIGTFRDLSSSGGDVSFIDVTTIHDSIAKEIPGLASAISYTSNSIWDVSDTGLNALKLASDTQAQRGFTFTFATGQIMSFNGYVSANLLPTGSAQDLVTTPVTVNAYGTPAYYAS